MSPAEPAVTPNTVKSIDGGDANRATPVEILPSFDSVVKRPPAPPFYQEGGGGQTSGALAELPGANSLSNV